MLNTIVLFSGSCLRTIIIFGSTTSKFLSEGELAIRLTLRSWGLRLPVLVTELDSGYVAMGQFLIAELVVLVFGWFGRLLCSGSKIGVRETGSLQFSGQSWTRLSIGLMSSLLLRRVVEIWGIFLSLEMSALSIYILVGFSRGSAYGTESARKYYRIGAIVTGVLICSIGLRYFETGRITMVEFGLASDSFYRFVRIWVRLFKLGVGPVHLWMVDVYEYSPPVFLWFLRIVPKLTILALLIRVETTSGIESVLLIFVLGLRSIWLGGLGLIGQLRWKSFRIYSGLGYFGILLLGMLFSCTGEFFVAISLYPVLVILSWGPVSYLSFKFGCVFQELKYLVELRGLGYAQPALSITRLVVLFALAGLPPTMGFVAKLGIWISLVGCCRGWLRLLVGFSLLGSIVGVLGYLRVGKLIWFDEFDVPGSRICCHITTESSIVIGLGTIILFFGVIGVSGVEILGLNAAIEFYENI